jgi:hypothetical protein
MGQKVHPYGFRLGYTKPWKWTRFAGVSEAGARSGHPERSEGSR